MFLEFHLYDEGYDQGWADGYAYGIGGEDD